MTSSLAPDARPSLPVPTDTSSDPFTSNPNRSTPHRFSNFDHEFFATGPGLSPTQAKRALEAHLAETDRRLDEAAKLGTALVSQRKALAEQLQEVGKIQAEGELGPDLRKKLVDIEREYNDLARESTRAFLPKQRVSSHEANAAGSPYVPDGRGKRRSISPTKFESQATGSPTKLSVPNRKIRNQPSNRVHDIEFATEISTSLIAQVRNLQSLLSERDDEVKNLQADKTRFEIESESLQQRVKSLDESEHRYKEENWNLETRLQEVSLQQREAADREKKLMQALNLNGAEKTAAQKELDETKLSHSRLTEEHVAVVKHHDIELGSAKRNLAIAESERAAMQRKIDELTSQNQELAKAFSLQRGRAVEREPVSGVSEDDLDMATDNVTPEHSPPPSPIKGTPRHSVLETETMKSSLHHAQRTLQSQRSQLHREKTEKLELRRIIQDLRDDLEKARSEAGAGSSRRSRKVDSREFKKSQRLLGSFRSSKQVILTDDPEWEDNNDASPGVSSAGPAPRGGSNVAKPMDASDHFETANEASESAFETANERATETEDFQTGNERVSGSDDAETETEGLSIAFGRMRRPPSLPAGLARHSTRLSFDSTASTSADEDDVGEMRTPTATLSTQRSRLRSGRGPLSRSSRQTSEEPSFRSSPASFISTGTPQLPGQSLFTELQDVGASDEESYAGTPSRRSLRSYTGSTRRTVSPAPAIPELRRAVMVDSSVMTDPVKITTELFVEDAAQRPTSMQSVINAPLNLGSVAWRNSRGLDSDPSRPQSYVSYSDAGAQHEHDFDEKLSQFPVPPTSHSPAASLVQPPLALSPIQSEDVQPREELAVPPASPTLRLSSLATQNVEPVAEPESPRPVLALSTIAAHASEPVPEPEIPQPVLALSTIAAHASEPVPEPEAPPPVLALSAIAAHASEPVPEPEAPPPVLALSAIAAHASEPVPEPETPRPVLALSTIATQGSEPVAEPEPRRPELTLTSLSTAVIEAVAVPPPSLTLSTLAIHAFEPEPEPEREVAAAVVPLPVPVVQPLTLSAVMSEHLVPVSEPTIVAALPPLSFSSVRGEQLEPVEAPEVAPVRPSLVYSGIAAEHVGPVPEPQPIPPTLGLSSIVTEGTLPVMELPPLPPMLALSSIAFENVEPVSPVLETQRAPSFDHSPDESTEKAPVSLRSRKRDGLISPMWDESLLLDAETDRPETPPNGKVHGSVPSRNKSMDVPPVIAEDETRQSPGGSRDAEMPDSQRLLKEISSNSNAQPSRRKLATMSDQGAQTVLTSGAIGTFLSGGSHRKGASVSSAASVDTTGTARIRMSQESFDDLMRREATDDSGALETSPASRPSSSASRKGSMQQVPPLPSNHRQMIDAARSSSSRSQRGSMGPPLWPASAMKQRPRTPRQPGAPPVASGRDAPASRGSRTGSAYGTAEVQSPGKRSMRSRQSSVSSFASELDSRFNIRPGDMSMSMTMAPAGFSSNTDPRMIQAITQTMIGEYLWKYTRKTGRGEMSERRHRRYFWVHPYTRTLYWSDLDPSTAGRTELKAKSVPIEGVRVVTDDNPMPPGLHRKSLVIISPGRTIKFTCITGQRHETWFNALSYLLLRTGQDGQSEAEEVAEHITREDVDEFNVQFDRRPADGNGSVAPPSLSSYNSRATRVEPADEISIAVPTLTPTTHKQASATKAPAGTFSKLSGYWKAGAPKFSDTLSSLRGRGPQQDASIYEASQVHDSAEDIREMIERQDRESDRLENVRACCDGKHDVGTLHRDSRRGRGHPAHSHPGPASSQTPAAPARPRS
ncbi:hypothetical protein RJ55_05932 [Drechmeria coniospora]|nr:hypothetical protein RJ55_05932 [Drechmeria coniospora]